MEGNLQTGNPATRFPWAISPRRTRRWQRAMRRAAGVLLAGLLVALGCVVFLAGISWVRSQPAVEVVQAQLQAIQEGKVEQAYALFSNGYQAGISLPMFRRWMRRQQQLAHVRNLQFWGRSVWGGIALLRGSFEDELGHRYPVRYLLIRQNGSWRVHQFQLSPETSVSQPNPERLLRIGAPNNPVVPPGLA